MAVTTADVVVHGTKSTPVPIEAVDVRYALKISFAPGQTIWIISHNDVVPLLPDGASYLPSARIAAGDMPDISRNAGFSSGTSTISKPTYLIVDIQDEFSDEIANKNINGVGTLNAAIREYEFEAGENIVETMTPKFTGVIQNHTRSFNTVTLETADVNLELDVDILEPKIWRLKSFIDEDQDTIPTTLNVLDLPDNQFLFEHSTSYLANPGETVGYVQTTTGEIFSYTAFVDVGGVATFTGVERGVLGSARSVVNMPENFEPGQEPDLMEWVLLDETATSMFRGLVTGLMVGIRQMPLHWSANASSQSIEGLSLGIHHTRFRLQFQNPGKVSCRDFYESEVLAPMRVVMVTNGWGQLVWTPRVLPVDADAGGIVLDETNCVTANQLELRHIKDEIYPSIKLLTDFNPFSEKFLSPVIYRDPVSAAHNNLDVEHTKEYAFKGIHVGIHTDPQKRRLAATFGDDHFYETLGLTLESYINNIQLGTLITVRFDNVRDDAADSVASVPLLRTFMVTESHEKRSTRTTVYELSGSMYVQSLRQAGNSLNNMSPAEYRRGKINLATLPGMGITNGVAAGTITLLNGREYYYVDADETGEGLEFSGSLNVTISGTGPSVKIFVFGPFVNRTTLDFTARSSHRVGRAGTQNSAPTSGEPGYALSCRSTGSINTVRRYGALLSEDEYYYQNEGFKAVGGARGTITPGLNARAPDVVLDLNDGVLGGVPDDLGGTGGPGGPSSKHFDPGKRPNFPTGQTQAFVPSTNYLSGTDGGKGGGGLVICSWGGGNATGGTIILNGAQGGLSVQERQVGSGFVRGSRGGGGGPGSLLWIVDGGAHAAPSITPQDVIALHGDSTVSGTPLMPFGVVRASSTDTYRSHIPGTPRTNQFEAVVRIVYTPEAAAIQSRTGNEVDLFFQNQRDGRVELIVQDSRPSNANVGDMWMTPTAADGINSQPNAEVLDNNGWRRLDWDTDNRVYEFLLFSRREFDGNTVYFGSARPTDFDDGDLWRDPNQDVTWILHTTGEDEVLTRGGTQVGDERLADPNFVLTATAGQPYTWHWHITSDPLVMPILTVAAKSVAGTGGFTLPPPFNPRVAVYGRTAAELFWDRPSDVSNVLYFQIYLNGALIDTTADNTVDSYLYEGLTEATSYIVGVRSSDGVEYSQRQTYSITTGSDVEQNVASIVSVTVSGGFKLGTPPTGTGGRPTMSITSAGPTINITTANVEDTRQVWIEFSGGLTASVVVTNDAMSYTPPTPGDLIGQTFSAYVANEAGQAVTLSNIAYQDGGAPANTNTPPATANPAGPPQLLTPVDGAVIYGTTHLFEFVPNSEDTLIDWIIRLGTDSGATTTYLDWRANSGATREYSVTVLPANGSSVYCEFSWKVYAGDWTTVVTTFTSLADT